MAGNVKRLPAIPELSVDTRTLMERLQRAEVGELVTYSDLSGLIGRDVQRAARHLLETARNRLEHDDQIIFAAVIGQGIKRLSSLGVVGTGEQTVQRIRRMTRKGARRMAIVPLSDLSDQDRRRLLLYQAMFGVIAHMTKPKTVKAVEAKCDAAVPTAKMLEAIRETL